MNDILSAIKVHLNRQLSVSELDYYQVIGLEPFCSDKSKIESAIRAAHETLRQSEPPKTTDAPENGNSFQVVQKLLRQAQAILLDPAKKTAYDSQLAKLFESHKKHKELGKPITATTASIGILTKSAPKTNSTNSTNSHQVTPPNETDLLPAGDPMQPFLINSANHTANPTPPSTLANLTSEKRRTELSELFPSLMLLSHPTEQAQEQVPAWLIAADRKPTHTPTTTNKGPTDPPAPNPTDLVVQLRRKRQQRNLLAVGSLILAAIGLLGFASFRFVTNRMQVAQQDQKPNRDKGQANAGGNEDQGPQAGTKSPELVIAPNKGRRGKPNSVQPLPELPTLNRDPAETNSATPNAAPQNPTPQNPAVSNPASQPEPSSPSPSPAMKPDSDMKPEPGMKPEPAPSDEPPEWKSSMTQAKDLLSKGDLEKFEPLMSGLLNKAVTAKGKAQTQRLDQAGQLYKIYVESFEEAKRKAKGASSLKVGNTEVSIVETTAEKIIVRSGENKTYEWGKLPFGMAVAISDLGLSESSPVDMASRAIYFSLTPFYQEAAKANNLITKRIDGWLERSAGKDSIRADIKEFLTDKYE